MKKFLMVLSLMFVAAPALADTGVRIVVPAHDIARGETIGDSDLVYGYVAAANVMSGTATSMDALIGMQARRVLHAGESMRNDDVRHPILVIKGATVTMTFEAPGVTLTLTGRAMSEGGVGDTVVVQNPASFRQVSAIVTGAGAVKALSGMASTTRVASSK